MDGGRLMVVMGGRLLAAGCGHTSLFAKMDHMSLDEHRPIAESDEARCDVRLRDTSTAAYRDRNTSRSTMCGGSRVSGS